METDNKRDARSTIRKDPRTKIYIKKFGRMRSDFMLTINTLLISNLNVKNEKLIGCKRL